MYKRALLLLAIATLPVSAATVVTRTGATSGSLSGVTSLAVSWTQAAGTTYSGVSVAVMVHSTNGSAATATAYLTDAIGAAATAATNQLATAAVSVSSATATSVTISFASAPTLPPGTYYVVLSNLSANFAWDFVSGGATETVGTGVTSNGDQVDLATPAPVFPPSSTTFVGATAGGSSKVLVFSATGTLGTGGGGGGTPPPTGVPTLGAWAIFGTVLLLGGSGVLLMKRRSQE